MSRKKHKTQAVEAKPQEKIVLKDDPTDLLADVIHWLCSPRGGNNFYGRIINGCRRMRSENCPAPGAVSVQNNRHTFVWNPTLFAQIPVPLRMLVVIHEAGHVALQHIERWIPLGKDLSPEKLHNMRSVFNIAADMADNDFVLRPYLEQAGFKEPPPDPKKPKQNEGGGPWGLIWPDSPEFNFPTNLSFEQYLEKLLDKCKKDGYDPMNHTGKMPNWLSKYDNDPKFVHNWVDISNMSDAEIERLEKQIERESKKLVKSAYRQTVKNRGTISGELQNYIDALLEEPTIPWNVILRRIVKRAIASKLQESLIWPNVALLEDEVQDSGIEPFPGLQNDYGFVIHLCLDSSGSVRDEEYVLFLQELKGILQEDQMVEMKAVIFDAQIQEEKTVASFTELEELRHRKGYGGTDFGPPLRRAGGIDTEEDWEGGKSKELARPRKADLVIMLTDGEAPIPEYKPPGTLLWVLTPEGRESPEMQGQTLKIEPKK